jgi:hypothetical protein
VVARVRPVTDAERKIVSFVVWNLRTGALPADIREAAGEVAAAHQYPRPFESERYQDGEWQVTLLPADTDNAGEHFRPVLIGPLVDDLIHRHPDAYCVLIQRVPLQEAPR